MELKKRKAEHTLVSAKAIKGTHVIPQDDDSVLIQLLYVDSKYDPQHAYCSPEVMRVVENKKTSKSKAVALTRKPNMNVFLERDKDTILAIHLVPEIDGMYKASRKDADGNAMVTEYKITVDKATGSMVVEDAPTDTDQRVMASLIRALAAVAVLKDNEPINDKWLITSIRGNTITVEDM